MGSYRALWILLAHFVVVQNVGTPYLPSQDEGLAMASNPDNAVVSQLNAILAQQKESSDEQTLNNQNS